ncbi:MAG: MFS transporter [Eggerthellaceae bacterium]|nr:MFS transporter [Eggerthellaceae bacterium]
MVQIVELCIDLIIGGLIDRRHSSCGRFKPCLLSGMLFAGICITIIFAALGGL